MPELRQRNKKGASPSEAPSKDEVGKPTPDTAAKPKPTPSSRIRDEDRFSLPLDIARFIVFLLIASCGVSYLATGGTSFFWGNKTGFITKHFSLARWQALWGGELQLTPSELGEYDGTNPDKPIYLSINGTIYDVSSNPRVYGPGGSYHWFAGVDASRAYVTGCFSTHRTMNMKGVELMHLPIDDPETDSYWGAEELERMRKEEMESAEQQVFAGLKHWVDFFAKNDKYHKVGVLVQPVGWDMEEPPEWCDVALKGRRKRKIPKV